MSSARRDVWYRNMIATYHEFGRVPLDSTTSMPARAGLMGRCPRCGKGHLFTSAAGLAVTPRCGVCDLDLSKSDTGDGPAVFVILILGMVLFGLALLIQFRFDPPLWLLLTVIAPVTLGATVGMLRPLKGLLIALHYCNRAGPGRLAGE